MLGGCPIIAFVPVTDVARARTFYQDRLGLRVTGEDDFAVTMDAHGIMLRLVKTPAFAPAPFTVLGWRVADVVAAVHTLCARGITFEQYELDGQDLLGVWSSPGGARVAWLKDPDGNVLSVTQLRPMGNAPQTLP